MATKTKTMVMSMANK
jgi:hypothetical protein